VEPTGLALSPGFVLQDAAGSLLPAQQISDLAQQAVQALGRVSRLTLDARDARTVLIGLVMAQLAPLDIALAREGRTDELAVSPSIELARGVRAWPDTDSMAEQAGLRLFTSGTTGRAKSALYSLQRLRSGVRQHPRGEDAVWLLTYEPASFAGIQVLLTAAINGARLLAPERSIDALADALRGGTTHVSATPSFWRVLLAAVPADLNLPLKVITLGGEASSQALLDILAQRFPLALIRHIYASTEAGVGFTVADGKAGFPAQWLDHPVEGVQLRIREDELEIRSARGMLGYAQADAPVASGWLRTGDLVELRNDRVLFLGRRDSVVNIGGTKVVPEKIEALLEGGEGVADISVQAHPNPILGHILIAQVCCRGGANPVAVEAALKARAMDLLPPVARPARYRFVDSVVLESGKKGRKHVSQ